MIKTAGNGIRKSVTFKHYKGAFFNAQGKQIIACSMLSIPDRWVRCAIATLIVGGLSGAVYAHNEPGDAAEPQAHSAFHLKNGETNLKQGNMNEALVNYKAAFDVANGVSEQDQRDAVWQHDLSVSLTAIGDIEVAQQDLMGALTSYRKSLDIRKKLLKSEPDNISYLLELSELHKKIGNIFVEQGNVSDALMSYRASVINAMRLSEDKPENELWMMSMAWRNWRVAQRGNDQREKWSEVLRILDMLEQETGTTEQHVKAYQIADANYQALNTSTK